MRVPRGLTCKVMRGPTLAASVECGKTATRIITTECAHGHKSTNVVCSEHAMLLLSRKDMLCQPCAGIDGHRCPRVAAEERTT